MATIETITLNPALDMMFEVERMIAERKLRGSAPELHPGGGGINVARVAARLGADVEAVWIGGGNYGATVGELLASEGVVHHQVPTNGDTRLSIHVEERATGDMYRFVLPGPPITEPELDEACKYVAEHDAAFVVLSGSLPPSLPADTYARLAARMPARARVVLDTSDEALGEALAGRIYLAKPNRNELGRLLGKKLDSLDAVASAAREVIGAGRVEVLAVSLAEDGLMLVTRDDIEHIRAPEVEMVSAVGAGDSTVAGIVVGLARGLPLARAARLGVAAGTAAVLTPGSEVCRPEDVERLYAGLIGEQAS